MDEDILITRDDIKAEKEKEEQMEKYYQQLDNTKSRYIITRLYIATPAVVADCTLRKVKDGLYGNKYAPDEIECYVNFTKSIALMKEQLEVGSSIYLNVESNGSIKLDQPELAIRGIYRIAYNLTHYVETKPATEK